MGSVFIGNHGNKVDDDEVNDLIRVADKDEDGRISYEGHKIIKYSGCGIRA